MLKELLKDHQLYHSEFQQDNFITVQAGGTLYGQYKQALRELYKRTRGLREAYCNKEKLEVEIDEQEYLTKKGNQFKRRYAEIEHKRKVMQMEEIERLIKDTEREFKRFYQQAICLKKQLGELTEKRKQQLDKEMWIYKVKEMAIIDFMTQHKLSPNTYELILSFPQKDRKVILEEINQINISKLADEYESDNKSYLNKLELEDIDIKCLLEN